MHDENQMSERMDAAAARRKRQQETALAVDVLLPLINQEHAWEPDSHAPGMYVCTLSMEALTQKLHKTGLTFKQIEHMLWATPKADQENESLKNRLERAVEMGALDIRFPKNSHRKTMAIEFRANADFIGIKFPCLRDGDTPFTGVSNFDHDGIFFGEMVVDSRFK